MGLLGASALFCAGVGLGSGHLPEEVKVVEKSQEIKDIADKHRLPIGLTLKMSYVHPKDIWDFFLPEAVQEMRNLVSDKQMKAKSAHGELVVVKTGLELDQDIRDGVMDRARRPAGYAFSDEAIQTAVKYFDEAAPPAIMDVANDRGDPVLVFYKKSLFLVMDTNHHVFMIKAPIAAR